MNRQAACSSSFSLLLLQPSCSSFFRDCWSCHHISDPAILFHRSKQPHNYIYVQDPSFFSYKRILTVSEFSTTILLNQAFCNRSWSSSESSLLQQIMIFFWIKSSATNHHDLLLNQAFCNRSWSSSVAARKKRRRRRRRNNNNGSVEEQRGVEGFWEPAGRFHAPQPKMITER